MLGVPRFARAKGVPPRRAARRGVMSHMEKMSQFASQADSFINAALDQLDDAVEQAVMDQGGDADAIAKHALSASKLSEVRAAVSFWSDLDVDARREEWRDAAMQMTSSKESGAAVKRALGDAARAAHAPDATEAHQKALVKAMAAEIKALTSRVDFAETAFMSMLNDLDEAPDPAPALAAAADAAAYVSSAAAAAATSARRLETARAELAAASDSAAANASAAAELAALRAAFDDKVEAAARERLADADARATSAEAAAETARRAAARAESEAADARRDLDAAQSRVFDLEEARTADTARASEAEAEAAASEAEGARRREAAALGECQRLRREVRRLRERLEGASGSGAETRGDESRSQSEALDDAALALGGGVDAASLRERLAVQISVVAQLKAALEDAESTAERDAAAFRASEESRARETERLRDELAAAAAEAASRPPPEAIASMETRIRTLLALVDAEDGDALDAAAAAAANGDAAGAPLVAARERNRRLAADLAEARREAAEARLAAERAEARAVTAERRGAAKDAAVAELEKHLAAATNAKTEDANKISADADAEDAGVVGALFGAAGLAAAGLAAAESEKTPPVGSASSASASDAALLPVVAGQRDRHARRAAELETRVGEVESELEKERADAAKLRADNIGLFDKVKYLQTFYAERGASGPGTRVVRVDADGVPAPGANARYGCGFGGVSLAVDGAGPLGALARKRAAKFRLWGRGRGERDAASFDDVPGGDAEGLLGRYAEASAAARETTESRGARERPKGRMVRAFFVVYFALVHAFLARVLVSSATARWRA